MCNIVRGRKLPHILLAENVEFCQSACYTVYIVENQEIEAYRRRGAFAESKRLLAIGGVSCRCYFGGYVSRCKCLDTDNVYAKSE